MSTTESTITVTVTKEDGDITDLGLSSTPGADLTDIPTALMIMAERSIDLSAQYLVDNGYDGGYPNARRRIAGLVDSKIKALAGGETTRSEVTRHDTEEDQ